MKLSFNYPHEYDRADLQDEFYALAHECLRSGQLLDKYQANSKMRELILDNGADELGIGVSGEQLRWLIGVLKPTVAILPDVLKKGPQTVMLSEQFLAESEWMPYQPDSWMGVAQGRTLNEFMTTFQHWVRHPDVSVIGIPYDVDFIVSPLIGLDDEPEFDLLSRRRAFRRLQLLKGIEAEYGEELRKTEKTLHLLGSNDLFEIFTLMRHSELDKVRSLIRSHDTTAPFAAAQSGVEFFVSESEISYGSTGKSWKSLDHTRLIEDLDLLKWNLLCYFVATKPRIDWPLEIRVMFDFSLDEAQTGLLSGHVLS